MRKLRTTLTVAVLIGSLWFTIAQASNRRIDSPEEVEALKRDSELRTDQMVRDLVDQGMFTESELEAIRRESSQRIAEKRAAFEAEQARLARIVWGAAGVLAFLGLLPPVSTLWIRLTIRRDARGQVLVTRVGAFPWPRTRRWAVSTTSGALITAQQVVVRFRYGGQQPAGYRWHVRVFGADAAGNGTVMAEFRVHAEAARPEEGGPLPRAVASFLDALEGIMNVPLSRAFNVLDYGDYSRTLIHAAPTVASTSQSYANLDEMPQDVRAKFEKLMKESERGGEAPLPITYRDSSGRVQRFDSVDEMPPDIRAKYERHMRKHNE
jgi:hypothetical protein